MEYDDGDENKSDVAWFVCRGARSCQDHRVGVFCQVAMSSKSADSGETGGNPVGPGLTEKEWRRGPIC